MPRKKNLSESARLLLRVMKKGTRILVRATTGRASYSSPGFGEKDVTETLLELKSAGLVEVVEILREVGWAWYGPTEQAQGEDGEA